MEGKGSKYSNLNNSQVTARMGTTEVHCHRKWDSAILDSEERLA
jgi:hypothetical protein